MRAEKGHLINGLLRAADRRPEGLRQRAARDIADACRFDLEELAYEYPREASPGRHAPPRPAGTTHLAGARVLTDPAGNSKLAKGSEGGRRMRAKDDAAAAAILAVALGVRRGTIRTSGGAYFGVA